MQKQFDMPLIDFLKFLWVGSPDLQLGECWEHLSSPSVRDVPVFLHANTVMKQHKLDLEAALRLTKGVVATTVFEEHPEGGTRPRVEDNEGAGLPDESDAKKPTIEEHAVVNAIKGCSTNLM